MEKLQETVNQLLATVSSMRMVQDSLVVRLTKLEETVKGLESGAGKAEDKKPKEPEPILVCVQCEAKYKESENAAGGCSIHPGALGRSGRGLAWDCCRQESYNYESAFRGRGCKSTGIKHRPAHHRDYPYHMYKHWLNDVRNNQIPNGETWIRADQPDYEDHKAAFGQIGLLSDGQLYILCGKGGSGDFLAVLGAAALADMDTKVLYSDGPGAEDENVDGYILRVEWIHNDKMRLKLKLRSLSDAKTDTRVVCIPLHVEAGKIVKDGELKHYGVPKMLADLLETSTAEKTLRLPEPVREGPSIRVPETVTAKRHECEGDSPVKLAQIEGKDSIQIAQSFTRDGVFTQYVTSTFTVTNPGADKTSVVKARAQYRAEGGDCRWTDCGSTRVGVPYSGGSGGLRVDWVEDGAGALSFALESKDAVTLSVQGGIQTEGEGGNDNASRSRIYKTYPQPLQMRTVFTDIDGKTVSIVTEAVNPPLELPSMAERGKSWKAALDGWVECDDVERDERIFMATYPSKDSREKAWILRAWHGTYWTLTESDVLLWAYKARKDKADTLPLDQFSKDVGQGKSVSVAALCDPARSYLPHALQITLKTETSSVVECVSIPHSVMI